MARTVHVPVMLQGGPASLLFVAADATNGDSVVMRAGLMLIARNTDGAASHHLTVHSFPDPFDREGNVEHDIPASGAIVTQAFPVAGWAQADRRLWYTADSVLVEVAAVRLSVPSGELGSTLRALNAGRTVFLGPRQIVRF